MSAAAIEARLGAARAQVAAAREALTEGQSIDLGALAENVDAACADLAALSGAKIEVIRPRLAELYDELNELAEALRHEYDAVRHALGELNTREHAQKAYRRSPGSGGG